jgi:predicted nuclease with TOPRIM domain
MKRSEKSTLAGLVSLMRMQYMQLKAQRILTEHYKHKCQELYSDLQKMTLLKEKSHEDYQSYLKYLRFTIRELEAEKARLKENIDND